MKVFLSYGHNDHTALVNRVFDVLLREGHEPWKDDRYEGSSGIPAAADFTEVIYRAILDSDFVIAFVTAATQNRQYCMDERQYAYNHKAAHFIQIRLDDVEIKLGNSRSYIDMGDVEGANGEIHTPLFEEKLKSLWAAFRDPKSFAEGGLAYWAKFEAHLRVKGASELIGTLEPEDFVGREWLTQRCREWAMDASAPCRLFTILGEAGTGKSAFVRHLAADRELVRSVHVCIYDRPSTRNIRDTLKDLAFVLAKNSNSYYDFLKERNLACIREMGFDGIFEYLFLEPLKNVQEKIMLIIDGLDEMEESGGFIPLMKLFRQYAGRLNPNISFLITARPDAYILSKLDTVPGAGISQRVLLDEEMSREDLRRYIHGKLEGLESVSSALEEKLLTACDGNFEYLAVFFREIQEGALTLTDEMAIPRGLYGRYAQYLDRRMELSGQSCHLNKLQRRIMELLADAMEPLPLDLLGEILEEDPEDLRQELDVFGSLVRQQFREEGLLVSLFTKGFRDFLLEKNASAYRVSQRNGSDAIAAHVLGSYKKETDFLSVPYMDRWGWVHLLNYANREPAMVTEYLRDQLETAREATVTRITRSLASGDRQVLQGYMSVFRKLRVDDQVIRCLKAHREKQTMEALAAELEKAGSQAEGWILAADAAMLDITSQALDRAKKTCAKALEYLEKEPIPEGNGILLRAYWQMGDIQREHGLPENIAEAINWYRKALVLAKKDYRKVPDHENRQRLVKSYILLGDMERRKNTRWGRIAAAKWYRRILALEEGNHGESSSYESSKNLMIVYERLGDIEKQKKTMAGYKAAKEWYLKKSALDRIAFQDNPCYESRRSLLLGYARLGSLEEQKKTSIGRTAAVNWYRSELPLSEENYRQFPSYESRRDLALTYVRLGNTEKASGEKTAAAALYQKARTLIEENTRQYPCYESFQDMSSIRLQCPETGETASQSSTQQSWYWKAEMVSGETEKMRYPKRRKKRWANLKK